MFSKLQKAIVGVCCKNDDNDTSLEWYDQRTEGGMVLVTNGLMIASIPVESYFINLENTKRPHRHAGGDLVRIVKNVEERADRHIDKLDQIEIRGRDKLQLLQDNSGTIYKVNEKLLGYFEEFSYEILGSSPKEPILLKFMDDILGVILPVV